MPISNVVQLGAAYQGTGNSASAINGALGASQPAHFQTGIYSIPSQPVVFKPGTLAVAGGVTWQPANSTPVCLDGRWDLGLRSDNMGDCAGTLAPLTSVGASTWTQLATGYYRLASQLPVASGKLVVDGTLDWYPAL